VIIWSASRRIVPFINVDGICAEALDLRLNIMLQAVNGSQYTDNTEDPDGNAKQRKKCAEFILPQLLHGHFKTTPYYFDSAAHKANLQDRYGAVKDFIQVVIDLLA